MNQTYFEVNEFQEKKNQLKIDDIKAMFLLSATIIFIFASYLTNKEQLKHSIHK